MAIVPCPKCHANLQVASATATSVRCPKCQRVFSPSTASKANTSSDEKIEESSRTFPKPPAKQAVKEGPGFEVVDDDDDRSEAGGDSRKKSPSRDSDDDDEPLPRMKRRPSRDDEDEEPGTRRRQKRRGRDDGDDDEDAPPRRGRANRGGGKNKVLLISGIVFSGLLIVGVIIFFAGRFLNDSLAFSGKWPEVNNFQVVSPGDTVTLHIEGVEDRAAADEIMKQIGELIPSPGRAASAWNPTRLTVMVNPVKDAKEFAGKITFGKVHLVHGSTIDVIANKSEGSPSSPSSPSFPSKRDQAGLNSPDLGERMRALQEIETNTPADRREGVKRELEPLLFDSETIVRNTAAEIYCSWATKENVPTVLRILSLDGQDFRVKFALKALARLKEKQGLEPIVGKLENFFSRHDAQETLIAYGPMAEEEVIKSLKHTEWEVKAAACEVLSKIGGEKSLEALQPLARDRDFQTKVAAQRAIEAIKKRM